MFSFTRRTRSAARSSWMRQTSHYTHLTLAVLSHYKMERRLHAFYSISNGTFASSASNRQWRYSHSLELHSHSLESHLHSPSPSHLTKFLGNCKVLLFFHSGMLEKEVGWWMRKKLQKLLKGRSSMTTWSTWRRSIQTKWNCPILSILSSEKQNHDKSLYNRIVFFLTNISKIDITNSVN